MHRRVRYVTVMAVVMVIAVGIYLPGRSSAPQLASAASGTTTTTAAGSTTTTTAPATTTTPKGFSAVYLAVGASASLGYQPTGIVNYNGRRTNTGYANDLLELEKIQGVSLTLDQIGCPGETVQSFLSTHVTDHCYKLPKTQLIEAMSFLQVNKGEAGLVAIDLGFNNLRVCISGSAVNEACVSAAVAAVQVDMPKVVKVLKAAAGPHVRFVGLEYNDPFLAYFLDGTTGPNIATAALVALIGRTRRSVRPSPARLHQWRTYRDIPHRQQHARHVVERRTHPRECQRDVRVDVDVLRRTLWTR